MNECILVVDDDPAIVGAIAIALEKEGYRVLRAYNGIVVASMLGATICPVIPLAMQMVKKHVHRGFWRL